MSFWPWCNCQDIERRHTLDDVAAVKEMDSLDAVWRKLLCAMRQNQNAFADHHIHRLCFWTEEHHYDESRHR